MTITEAARLVQDGCMTRDDVELLGFTRKQLSDALRRVRPLPPVRPPLPPISTADIEAMRRARAAGYKLAEIGRAAGVTRQRVHQCLS